MLSSERVRVSGDTDDHGLGLSSDRITIQPEARSALEGARLGAGAERDERQFSYLILKLTSDCNYRCKYCYETAWPGQNIRMPTSIGVAAVSEALDMVSNHLTVLFHGGEPTLALDSLRTIVQAGHTEAKRLGKSVHFAGQTNGSRIDRQLVDLSASHHISWGISADGPPELNDACRITSVGQATSGALSAALRDLPEFTKACAILSTVTAATENSLLPIARYFKGLGFTRWNWSLFLPAGRGHTQGHLAFSGARVIASWNGLFNAVLDGEFDGFHVLPVVNYLRNFLSGPRHHTCLAPQCGAAREVLSISPDGAIGACDCVQGLHAKIGFVRSDTRDSLRTAYGSQLAQSIRSRDGGQGRCGKCIWSAICGAVCLGIPESRDDLAESICAISANVYRRIAAAVAAGGHLRRYWDSILKTTQDDPHSLTGVFGPERSS